MKPVRKNEPLSGLTSFIGFLLSIAGLILLVIFSALHGRTVHIVGFSIFGSGLILLYKYHLPSNSQNASGKNNLSEN